MRGIFGFFLILNFGIAWVGRWRAFGRKKRKGMDGREERVGGEEERRKRGCLREPALDHLVHLDQEIHV
jgi:hypothetical protein